MADSTLLGLSTGTLAADTALVGQNTSTATRAERFAASELGLLVQSADTITTANLTASVGTLHRVTIAGMTADRDFILPDTAAVGERVGVFVVDGDATYVLQIKTAATASEINGADASSTIWSSVFIKNEHVVFECVKAGGAGDTDWIVVYDGRISCTCAISDKSATVSHYAHDTQTLFAADTIEHDIGGLADLTGNRIVLRRAGVYCVTASALSPASIDGGEFVSGIVKVNGVVAKEFRNYASGASQRAAFTIAFRGEYAKGDYLDLYISHNEGAAITWEATTLAAPVLSAAEALR